MAIVPEPLELILAAGFSGIFVAFAVALWRNKAGFVHPDHPPDWWPTGGALWRGNLRSAPVLGVMAVTLVPGLLTEGSHEALERGVYLSVGLVVLCGLALVVTVNLFNWPKVLVPPHLRNQPGAMAEWRSRKR